MSIARALAESIAESQGESVHWSFLFLPAVAAVALAAGLWFAAAALLRLAIVGRYATAVIGPTIATAAFVAARWAAPNMATEPVILLLMFSAITGTVAALPAAGVAFALESRLGHRFQ